MKPQGDSSGASYRWTVIRRSACCDIYAATGLVHRGGCPSEALDPRRALAVALFGWLP